MIDKLINHKLPQKAKGIFLAKTTVAALLSASVLTQSVHAAEQEWWFDIEVILFERNLDTVSISETFEQSTLVPSPSEYVDLLTPYLTPDVSYLQAGLSYCRASKRLAIKKQHDQDFTFPKSENNPNNTLEQTRSSDQGLVDNSDTPPQDNFQYEVATTDIFSQPDDATSLPQTTNDTNTHATDSQANTALNTELALIPPPIQFDLIEWQIPSELPCAYAEQIDPSFASIKALQNTTSDLLPSDIKQRVPEIINGIQWQKKRSAFLLPSTSMRMANLYNKLKRQGDITPILHVNWRQQVKFGRKNGQTIRLFAGQNYAEQFDANGLPIIKDTDALFNSLNQSAGEPELPKQALALLPPEQQAWLARMSGESTVNQSEDLFAQIDAVMADNTPLNIEQLNTQDEQHKTNIDSAILKELWQLDGGLTVYLRNIGRVPYLHIDSHFNFRRPIFDPEKTQQIKEASPNFSEQTAITGSTLQQANYLQSANFNQLRRVISKQVHYFDHPLFGMIVRINRYRWPEIKENSQAAQTN